MRLGQRFRMGESVVASDAGDEDAFAHLRHAVVCGEVELVVDGVAGETEVGEHLLEEGPTVGHEEALDVLRDEDPWIHTSNHLDHALVEDRARAFGEVALAVDRDILAGEAADHDVGGVRQGVHHVDYATAAQVVVAEIGRVGIARHSVDVVGPDDVERRRS